MAKPKNVIQHHEWNTRNPKRLRDFYTKVFDWEFNDRMMQGYTIIEGIGGVFEITPEMEGMPTGITNYVNVENLDATEKLLRSAGATIYKSKQEVPGMGWFTIFADPDNNTVAVWEAMMSRPAKAVASAKKSAKKAASKVKASAKKAAGAAKKAAGKAKKAAKTR
jgi:uncharacterized protein